MGVIYVNKCINQTGPTIRYRAVWVPYTLQSGLTGGCMKYKLFIRIHQIYSMYCPISPLFQISSVYEALYSLYNKIIFFIISYLDMQLDLSKNICI